MTRTERLRLQKGIGYYNMNQLITALSDSAQSRFQDLYVKCLGSLCDAKELYLTVGLQPTYVLDSCVEQELLCLIADSVLLYRLGVKSLLPGCISVSCHERSQAPFIITREKWILL